MVAMPAATTPKAFMASRRFRPGASLRVSSWFMMQVPLLQECQYEPVVLPLAFQACWKAKMRSPNADVTNADSVVMEPM